MKMRYNFFINLIIGVLALFFNLFLSGCSTTEKFTITGPTNTQVYNPAEKMMGTISGTDLKVEVPSNDYYGYVLATDPSSQITAPFGLNVHKKVRYGEKAAVGVGYSLLSLGGGGALIGSLCLILSSANGDDDVSGTFGIMAGASAGVGLVGASMAWPASSRLQQLTHAYNFTYDSNQTISFEGLSKELLHPDAPKQEQYIAEDEGRRKRASSGSPRESNEKNYSAARKTKAQKLSKKVEGTYLGKGKLFLNKNLEEQYSDVGLIIVPIDDNTVSVRVLENNEDFFVEPLIFNVNSTKGGDYLLKMDGISDATITIDKNGQVKFTHPKVYIDDSMYKLVIEAGKR